MALSVSSNVRLQALLLIAAAAFPGTTLAVRPVGAGFPFPACPIFTATGMLCPGCGATRAIAALLHGDVLAAVHANLLILLLLAPTLCFILAALGQGRWLRIPPWLTLAVAGVAAGFTLMRNLSPGIL